LEELHQKNAYRFAVDASFEQRIKEINQRFVAHALEGDRGGAV
jgi:hypothetical protein